MNIRNCFFKPQNQEVKLEVEINMESTNFDSAKAEAIAAEIDGTPDTQKKDKEVVFENGIVDKVLFTSNKVVDDVGQYAVGVFNGRELHLTALKGMSLLNTTVIKKYPEFGSKAKSLFLLFQIYIIAFKVIPI